MKRIVRSRSGFPRPVFNVSRVVDYQPVYSGALTKQTETFSEDTPRVFAFRVLTIGKTRIRRARTYVVRRVPEFARETLSRIVREYVLTYWAATERSPRTTGGTDAVKGRAPLLALITLLPDTRRMNEVERYGAQRTERRVPEDQFEVSSPMLICNGKELSLIGD